MKRPTLFSPFLPLLLTPSSRALPTSSVIRPRCHDLTLSVPVQATNYELDVPHVDNNYEAVEMAIVADTWNLPNLTERIIREIHIDASYEVFAQLCFPEKGKDKDVLQVLTHGGGFDHRYWDSTLDPSEYNYVLAALNAGYTVFNYDRLGNGRSQKANAYTEVQAPLEIALLGALTQILKDGTLGSHITSTSTPSLHLPTFPKIVHVGHSIGSYTTAGFLAAHGDLSSGAILTGFGFFKHGYQFASLFGFQFAPENSPTEWGDLPSGYLTLGTKWNLQNNFFHRDNASDASGFTDEALDYAWSTVQPFTVGEVWSLRGFWNPKYAPEFKGPLQFFVGQHDFAMCAGECVGNEVEGVAEMLYPNATVRETYLQPGAGHALPFHRNASAGFQVSLDFLAKNGL